MMKREQEAIKVLFRLPPELKKWLAEEAARNWTSANAEAIRAIRQLKKSEERQRAAAG
jgi:predicted HicB family RNase H-like nuclease